MHHIGGTEGTFIQCLDALYKHFEFFVFQLSIDGFLSFESPLPIGDIMTLNKDVIIPLWTDTDNYTSGNVSYKQTTNDTLTEVATREIIRMFPGWNFTASWVFIGTWEKMESEKGVSVSAVHIVATYKQDFNCSSLEGDDFPSRLDL